MINIVNFGTWKEVGLYFFFRFSKLFFSDHISVLYSEKKTSFFFIYTDIWTHTFLKPLEKNLSCFILRSFSVSGSEFFYFLAACVKLAWMSGGGRGRWEFQAERGSTGSQYCSYQKEDSNSRSRFNLSWNTYCPMWRSVTDSRLRRKPGCFSGVKERTRKLVAARRGKYLLICSFACPSPLEGLKARPIIGGKIIIIKNTYYTHMYSAC